MSEIDIDRFIYVGRHLDDKIYKVPAEDIKWFNETRKQIEEMITPDDAFDYVINEMSMELFEHVRENMYDEMRDVVFEQEAGNRQE